VLLDDNRWLVYCWPMRWCTTSSVAQPHSLTNVMVCSPPVNSVLGGLLQIQIMMSKPIYSNQSQAYKPGELRLCSQYMICHGFTNIVLLDLCCIPLGSETRISESEVGGARRIPSFPLGTTTSDFCGTIFPTGKLIHASFRAQWNAALLDLYFLHGK